MGTKKEQFQERGRTSESALFYALKHSGKCNYNISHNCMMVNLNYLGIFVSILQT